MVETARDIVLKRGHAYLYKGKYPQVVVFSTSRTELDKLMRAFGGHSYKHGSGFIWVLSKRSELVALMQKISPCLPSQHGLESILGPRLLEMGLI